MLICHCHSVCDRTIRQCVRQGATSATEVGDACAAGTGCGGCTEMVERLIELELRRPEPGCRAARPAADARSETEAA